MDDQQKSFHCPGSKITQHQQTDDNFATGNILLSAEKISQMDAKQNKMRFDVFGGHKTE